MIKTYKSNQVNEQMLRAKQEALSNPQIEAAVAEILRTVADEGDSALKKYTEKFDRAKLAELKVSEAEIDRAMETIDEDFLAILKQAAKNIEEYHQYQKRKNLLIDKTNGIVLGQRFTSLEKVGIYVPGGTAAYPSTVLMNAMPAKIAGCKQIVMVTPPQEDGSIAIEILAAARLAGVTDIYKLGGAQAIAALAFGTETVPRVDKIVGPGNIYVATAKKQVFGKVDIDMIAGPSEILIVADDTADPSFIAADMLSQAEHDALASAMLICISDKMADKVKKQLSDQLEQLPRKDMAAKSLADYGAIIIADDLTEAVELVNAIAPEHLELAVEDFYDLLPAIRNAGCIFLGQYSPEPLGDYWAGPNHVLPTMGSARFFGPLSVDDFIKRTSIIYYPKEELVKVADQVATFAKREGLDAHARSMLIRTEEKA